MKLLASHAHQSLQVGVNEVERATQIEAVGMGAFDALHLACAEVAQVDVFLTTDDRLLRRCALHAGQIRVRVENPLAWLGEME